MKILSIRKGFQADHSSTSYEFFAIEKPLSRSERGKVASLSSRARPSRRRVSFIYNGEWSDLPGGWEPLINITMLCIRKATIGGPWLWLLMQTKRQLRKLRDMDLEAQMTLVYL